MDLYNKIRDVYYLLKANELALESIKPSAAYLFTDKNKNHVNNTISNIIDNKKTYDYYLSHLSDGYRIKAIPYVNIKKSMSDCLIHCEKEVFAKYLDAIEKIKPKYMLSVAKDCKWNNDSYNCHYRLKKIIKLYNQKHKLNDDFKTQIMTEMILSPNEPSIRNIASIRDYLGLTEGYDGTIALNRKIYGDSYDRYLIYLLDNSTIDFRKLNIEWYAKPSSCKSVIHEMVVRHDRQTVKQFISDKNLLYHAYYAKFYKDKCNNKNGRCSVNFKDSDYAYKSYVKLLESFGFGNKEAIKKKAMEDLEHDITE